MSLADKLYNARAIVRDHHLHGDELWGRFSASKEETAGYYQRLLEAYRKRIGELEERYPHFGDFEAAVSMLERAAGVVVAP